MKSWKRMELMEQLCQSVDFQSLKSNSERVAYMLDHVIDYDSAKVAIEADLKAARQQSGKSGSLCQNFLLEARLHMGLEDWSSALMAIHQAILYAPVEMRLLRAELYTIKSQVHFNQKDYSAALYSAELSFHIDQSCNLELALLKLNCSIQLNRQQPAVQVLDYIIAHPAILEERDDLSVDSFRQIKQRLLINEKTCSNRREHEHQQDYFSYRLDPRCGIEYSPVVGRHFVAKEDIARGEVLLQERPYSIVMEAEFCHRKCNSCFLPLKLKFFPCAYCTELIFCDQSCFQQAWNLYHRYECGLLSAFRPISSSACHVFRMISRLGGPLQAYQIEAKKGDYSIGQYLDEARQRDVPELEKSQEERNRAYQMSSILCDHNDKHSHQNNAYHSVIGLETVIMLDLVHGFRSQRPDRAFLLDLVNMVMVHIRRIVFNVFGWHEFSLNWTVRSHVANCQCLVGSLINHSCVPNVSWGWKDGVITYTTKSSIAKGTEITITYGPSKENPYYQRQERLNHYFFACKCAICLKDALAGDNLRCRVCHGPVVFHTAANLEMHLNAKCLCCYAPYEHFDQSIKELSLARKMAKSLSTLSLVFPCDGNLQRAIKAVKTIAELSLPQSEPNYPAILACSRIVQRHCLASSSHLDTKQLIEFALLFNRALPSGLPLAMLDGKSIESFKFWFEILLNRMVNLLEEDTAASGTDGDNDQSDPKLVWNACLLFYDRIQAAIRELTKDETNSLVQKIAFDQITSLEAKFNRCNIAQTAFIPP